MSRHSRNKIHLLESEVLRMRLLLPAPAKGWPAAIVDHT
jgi:hypothetical protein